MQLKTFVVLYREPEAHPLESPMGFLCRAEDVEHAEEQCANAYPQAEVVWVVDTASFEEALDDYYEEN